MKDAAEANGEVTTDVASEVLSKHLLAHQDSKHHHALLDSRHLLLSLASLASVSALGHRVLPKDAHSLERNSSR